ncbi:phage tail terminator protein [Castellaniella sp.]|uniref:phage tail terminator protein n=1 Tax=Castellaniella sp. TaxID=1955812 RepID=UPI002AFDEC0D|nr:minor capsid protein [Castellaniella sp.]
MMDREESIAWVLTTRIPALKGKLFINDLPASATAGVLIKEGYSGAQIDPEIKGRRQARFQIAIRDVRAKTAASKALAHQIMDALDIPGDVPITNGIFIKSCRPLTEPISYPITDGDNIEVTLNFLIHYFV